MSIAEQPQTSKFCDDLGMLLPGLIFFPLFWKIFLLLPWGKENATL